MVGDHQFLFLTSENCQFMNYVLVCPYVMSFEIPDNWNPVVTEIEILKRTRDEVAKSMQKDMTDKLRAMDIEISKLQSLEYQPVV